MYEILWLLILNMLALSENVFSSPLIRSIVFLLYVSLILLVVYLLMRRISKDVISKQEWSLVALIVVLLMASVLGRDLIVKLPIQIEFEHDRAHFAQVIDYVEQHKCVPTAGYSCEHYIALPSDLAEWSRRSGVFVIVDNPSGERSRLTLFLNRRGGWSYVYSSTRLQLDDVRGIGSFDVGCMHYLGRGWHYCLISR